MNCARWDLCGGYWVTDIPTAILGQKQTLTGTQRPAAKSARARFSSGILRWYLDPPSR